MSHFDQMYHEIALDRWKRFTYVDDLPDELGPFRKLLEEYSKVPPNETDELLVSTVSDILTFFVSSLRSFRYIYLIPP